MARVSGQTTPAPATQTRVRERKSVSIDTTAPVTAVTSPANGASIAGLRSVNVTVSSSDNIAVTKAELYINGRLVFTSAAGNFTYKWSTSKLARGTHSLQSRAYDAAGNTASSAVVSVTR